jgi:gas vesicle protein
MFGRKKKKQEQAAQEAASKKHSSAMDKIVMGAIIGTAIGSAVGVTMAPKKGKELRQDLKDQTKEVRDLTKETAGGFFRLSKLLFKRSKKQAQKKIEKSLNMDPKDMRDLPNEMEIIPPKNVDRN